MFSQVELIASAESTRSESNGKTFKLNYKSRMRPLPAEDAYANDSTGTWLQLKRMQNCASLWELLYKFQFPQAAIIKYVKVKISYYSLRHPTN